MQVYKEIKILSARPEKKNQTSFLWISFQQRKLFQQVQWYKLAAKKIKK